jgi:hypothetical protein
VPLDDAGLQAKFHTLVEPVLGAATTAELAGGLWAIEQTDDIAALVGTMAKPPKEQ